MEQSLQSNICLLHCHICLLYWEKGHFDYGSCWKKYCLFLDNLHYFDLKNVSIGVISLKFPDTGAILWYALIIRLPLLFNSLDAMCSFFLNEAFALRFHLFWERHIVDNVATLWTTQAHCGCLVRTLASSRQGPLW